MTFTACAVAANGKPSKRTPDILQTFRFLDQNFTVLNGQMKFLQDQLKATPDPKQPQGKSWRVTALQARGAARRIKRASAAAQANYRRQKNQTGVLMFGGLRTKAIALDRELISMSRARSRPGARRYMPSTQRAMLNLVLHFQAISGGYAAAHCDPGAWSCGVPKRELANQGFPKVALKWTCVSKRRSCGGILGAWTPPLVAKPITAVNLSQQ
jgi:hypothetical protein